ncbi:MAG: hypothetical protein MAG431_00698 [Chloroflexi bacterium]|nr:hypothetical protein [Chloroflexota bacterium]
MKKITRTPLLILLTIVLASCNMPGVQKTATQSPEQLQTFVAQTVTAHAAQSGQDPSPSHTPEPGTGDSTPSETPTATFTNTPLPTNTTAPTATKTPIPCNQAKFVEDVTIPDGTDFNPGDSFVKTWRLRNTGSCDWSSGYDIVFSSGDAMAAPSAVQLTTDIIPPGGTVDVSVTLTAPDDPGTYRGNWKLRDAANQVFGIQSTDEFWVEIDVLAPTDTPEPETVTINYSDRGQVDAAGNIANPNNAGDRASDDGLQGFITFDVSGIPDSATITSARLETISYDTLGDPFFSLGAVRAYVHNYGTVDAGDYTAPGVTGAIVRFSNEDELNDANVQELNSLGITGIENALASNQFQIRLQFKSKETDGDGVDDVLRAKFRLVVTYQP